MTYDEAMTKISLGRKNPNNFLKVQLSYGFYILLPYKEGITFLETLNHAEEYELNYGSSPTIAPIKPNQFMVSILSEEDYRDTKIANLMGVTLEELRAPQTTTT